VAPDYQQNGDYICEQASGINTGYVLYSMIDANPQSPTVGQAGPPVRSVATNVTLCPVPIVYLSAAISQLVTRDNCGDDETGTAVLFSVPTGAYQSSVSQADANALAQAYFDANAQAYANANGICEINDDIIWLPVYLPNGCFACQMRNSVDAGDVRDATQTEATQYARTTDNDGGPCTVCDFG
jgi:hypothetical protein